MSAAWTSESANQLRLAFDRTFIEARHVDVTATEDFIAVHVGSNPYLLRITEIAGVYNGRKITAAPSPMRELRGISGFRGTLIPVYDLAMLLGHPPSQSARWMVIAVAARVAFACDSFDSHLRFPVDSIATRDGAGTDDPVRQIVRSGDIVQPIVNIPSVVAAIRARASTEANPKEH